MLLPSTLGCDAASNEPSRPATRPKLLSFAAYQPQHLPSSLSPRSNPISNSCRALHAILGSPAPLVTSSTVSGGRELGNPFLPLEQHARPRHVGRQLQKQPAQRGANKRRRSTFEEDLTCTDTLMSDAFQHTPPRVRTPKRRRRVPLAMPLGLSADDFRALETPLEESEAELEPNENYVDLDMPPIHSPPRHRSCSNGEGDGDSAYGSSPSIEDVEWTIDDDRLLVETVLEKLKLSKHDWNDCARRLGKDRDSLGKRWTLLVGEGNVGLRRGGRISRTNLDISSW